MDRFDAIQAFARVVEAGSFTKASQTLNLSKPTVTQLVQRLEAQLRVKLLHRTTRLVKPTPDGAAYYERVRRVLAELEDADASLSSAVASPRGRLRVDVPSPLALMILIPALPDFHARYPEISLDMGVSDRYVHLVREDVDCVLRGGEIVDPSLVARKVGDLQFGVYASPGYVTHVGMPSHPRELEGPRHRIVAFSGAGGSRPMPFSMRRRGERIEVQGRYVVAVDDGVALLAAGLAGMGVCRIPRFMAAEAVTRGELVPLFKDWQLQPQRLSIAYPPNRHVSAKLRAFIDWIVELMRQHAPPLGPAA